MSNAITQKQFNEIKNKSNLSVVSFENGTRDLTYSGLTYIKAIDEIIYKQSLGFECLLIADLPLDEVSYKKEDYNKYLIAGCQK